MARSEAFLKLIDRYGHTPDDYDEGEEEDPREYLSGERELLPWVCITQHDEKVFFLPTFASSDEAQARATEYVTDDLFAEIPVEVFNLDTGESRRPIWSSLIWT